MSRAWLLVVAVALVARGAQARVVTYPGPPGIRPSEHYAVRVWQDGKAHESFVYLSKAQWRSNRSKDTSWTTFSFSGRVTVEVRKLTGSFNSCRILPSSSGIKPRRKGDSVFFSLDRPCKLAVDFDDGIAHPMLVFADPLEKDLPDPKDPQVIYFAPGVHEIGEDFDVGRGKTVYIAGGAYLKGTIRTEDATNTVIRGRGILSGEGLPPRSKHLVVTGWKTNNCLIEGITLINAPHYNVVASGRGNVVRNVKMISWRFSTDGVSTGPDGLVEDCFFKVNDDAVKLYFSGMKVRRCVIWQLENGAAFQISWNMPGDRGGFEVRNIDVIRCEHRWKNENCAVFCAIHGGSGHMHDYLFEDIRIENAPWRLFNITIQPNPFAKKARHPGRISNLVFRNVTADRLTRMPNVIRGRDPRHKVTNVLFENLRLGDKLVRRPEDGNFRLDPATTENVRFVVRP